MIIAIIGLIICYTYRRYAYSNNLDDFHIADTIGSLIVVPAHVFYFKSLTFPKYSFNRIIISCFIFNILYELIAITGIHGTFDYFDLLAICIATSVIYFYSILFVHENK